MILVYSLEITNLNLKVVTCFFEEDNAYNVTLYKRRITFYILTNN